MPRRPREHLTEREIQEQDRIAANRRKAELDALNARNKELKGSLADQIVKVQGLIGAAREAQEKAEDRAFALAIVGNLTSAIGTSVAAFAAVKTAPLTAAANWPTPSPGVLGSVGPGQPPPGPGPAARGQGPARGRQGPARRRRQGPGCRQGPARCRRARRAAAARGRGRGPNAAAVAAAAASSEHRNNG